MTYIPSVRNFDFIGLEELRREVDPYFNDLHDALTSAYYDNWRNGFSSIWQGYDVKATTEENKIQFDKLHGLIFRLRDKALYELNSEDPTPLTDEELGIDYQATLDSIAQLASEGFIIE